jgi:uncharacterized protein (DUF934 family)
MPLDRVIRTHPARIEADAWTLVEENVELPAGPVIVPLSTWLSRREALSARRDVGTWLAPDDDPHSLRGDFAALSVIAVHFPKAADGRGYSTAVLLRRLGFRGELRAFGDIGRDHLFSLLRCGFDAFRLPATRDPQAALAGLDDFSLRYQGSVDDPLPLYRRRTFARPANG